MSCGIRQTSSRPNANVNENTEKNIPLDRTFVTLYVIALLDEYERSVNSGNKPEVDPYREKILVKTENGKYAIVPDEVQQYAIKQWTTSKGINNGKPILGDPEDDENDDDSDNTLVDRLFQLVFYLLVIFLILYTLNLLRKYMINKY